MATELFDGPLTSQIDPQIAAGLNEVFNSLSKTQQGLLTVKAAAPETEAAMQRLYQAFAAGQTSVVAARAELERLAQGAPATAAEVRRLAQSSKDAAEAFNEASAKLRPYWENLDRLNERLEKVSAANRGAGASVGDFFATASHGLHTFEAVASAVEGAVERIAQRSAEGMRLARIQAELNVNFAEAQAQSRRFVSQTEIAGMTEHFASARMNLSQQEIGALTRGGARLAQMNGTSFEEQGGRIFSGIVGGELEVLRRFGPEMAALSGQAHTARERLEMFQRVVRDLGEPVDDAATSLERFREGIAQSERALAGGFTDELGRIAAPGGLLHSFTEGLGTNEAAMRSLGTAAGHYLGVAATATAGWLTMLGRVRTAVVDLHRPLADLARSAAGSAASSVASPLRRAATFALGAENAGSLENLLFGEPENEDLGAGRATGAQAPDHIETDAQRRTREHQEARLAEWRLETAQGATRKLNDPAAVARRNFRSIDAAQHRAGAAGRRQERADWQAILNASLERKRQAETDRLMTWEGLREKIRIAAQYETELDNEIRAAIEETRRAAERKATENAGIYDQSSEAYANAEDDKTQQGREATEARRNARLGRTLERTTGADVGDVGLDAEARAANDIASAWGNATDALTKHLDLVAQGRETWADVWTGIKETAERALIDIAMTEGKVELGRALGALAVGNFPGAALHTAAGVALLAIGGTASYLTGGAGDADRAREKEEKKAESSARRSSRVPSMDGGASGQPGAVTLVANFGGASFYGSGGPRQAAAEFIDLLNRHGPLSGAVLDARVVSR